MELHQGKGTGGRGSGEAAISPRAPTLAINFQAAGMLAAWNRFYLLNFRGFLNAQNCVGLLDFIGHIEVQVGAHHADQVILDLALP